MKNAILTLLFLVSYIKTAAQTITASPGWSVTIPASTITEAGSNYAVNATSAANQTLVSVTSGIFANYFVRVHRVDTDWNSNLSLWVQRTGNGTSGFLGSISGGLAFIQLTTTPQLLYSGNIGFAAGRNNVPIQYQIRGLSVLIPVKTYTTTVVYTVSN